MAFKVFAIALVQPNEEVGVKIAERYEDWFQFNETLYLVRCGLAVLSSDIADAVGLRGEHQIDGASGFVIRLRSAYSGYTRRDLWEWLMSHDDDWDADL